MKITISRLIFLCLFASQLSVGYAERKPKNVILFILEGMGNGHISAAKMANPNSLSLSKFQHYTLLQTASYDTVPDAAAASTSIACGIKTKNGFLGMRTDSSAIASILELAEKNHFACGIVTNSSLTQPTPASFVSHRTDSKQFDNIANDYLQANLCVMIGGGRKYFNERLDDLNLTEKLKQLKFQTFTQPKNLNQYKSGKLAALLYDDTKPENSMQELDLATITSLGLKSLTSCNKKGFLLIVHSQDIDWASHNNDTEEIIQKTLTTDQAIGKALAFAETNKRTLVIVCSTYETAGMNVIENNYPSNPIHAYYKSKSHTTRPTPLLSIGPGSSHFKSTMDATEIKPILVKLLNIKVKQDVHR